MTPNIGSRMDNGVPGVLISSPGVRNTMIYVWLAPAIDVINSSGQCVYNRGFDGDTCVSELLCEIDYSGNGKATGTIAQDNFAYECNAGMWMSLSRVATLSKFGLCVTLVLA